MIDDFEITVAAMEWDWDGQLKSGKPTYNLLTTNHCQLNV